MGDVIDRAVPFPLSSRHFGGMRSSRRSLSSATHPSQEKWCTTLCPLSSSARAAAGTHRWATSTQAVSGLCVETRGEAGLPSMNRGTPCSGLLDCLCATQTKLLMMLLMLKLLMKVMSYTHNFRFVCHESQNKYLCLRAAPGCSLINLLSILGQSGATTKAISTLFFETGRLRSEANTNNTFCSNRVDFAC